MSNNRINLETYNDLVSAIYDAANDPARWNEFLARLAQALNSHGIALRLLDSQSYFPAFSTTYGYDEGFTQEYTEHYYRTDITNPILAKQKAGTVQSRSAHLLDRDFVATEFYQDFGRKWGFYDVLGSYFIKQQDCMARIGVHRHKGRSPFSEEDQRLMALLVPHLQRAFDISRHIQTIKAQKESSDDAFDHLPFGIVLVDGSGKPLVVNQQADLISKQEGGITIKSDGLTAASSKDTQALKHLIQQATQRQEGEAYQGGAISIARAHSFLPLSIMVAPHNSVQPILGFEGPHTAAIVFISDPAQQQPISSEILSSLYGLTQAEARLAKELAQGRTLDEISDLYQVSKHTTRTQLKSIFSKTGLKRQTDLIRLILGGPASLNL